MPSKSATHRALVAASLAAGVSEIAAPLVADDTRRTLGGIRALGIRVDERANTWVVHGTGGRIPGGGTIDVGASGTSARFLAALAALGALPSTLDGNLRLRERPMSELLAALTALGAAVETPTAGVWPLRVGGSPVRGGRVVLSGARSSQFASALMLAAPGFAHGIDLEIAPPRMSFAYVRLTIEMLRTFGASVVESGAAAFTVPAQTLRAADVTIEGDHSSASYLLAAAAILGGRVRVSGLRASSVQPDARFLRDLASLGCRVDAGDYAVVVEGSGRIPPFAWDLADAPDLAPTAAVLALFADGPCVLSGVGNLALKESDRLAALELNLSRCGARVSVDGGTLSIAPPARGGARGAEVRVLGDHRIAMAFAIAALRIPGTTIDEPDAVAKSYPRFWNDFAALVRTGS